MAFSTFRTMMAAGSEVTPPPPGNTDTYTPHVASYILNNSGAVTSVGSAVVNNIILAGDSNYVLATTSDPITTSSLYASLIEKGTSFDVVPATSASKLLTNSFAGASPYGQVSGATVSTTGWIVSYTEASAGNVYSRYLTRSSNTLTSTVGQTTIYSGGDAATCHTCVLDGSNAIVMANNGSTTLGGTNTYKLITPTTLVVNGTVTDTNGGCAVQTWESLIGLTSTLGVYLSISPTFVLKAQGIDRSGTTLTINTSHNVQTTLSNSSSYNSGLFGACKISSSTILVAYSKSDVSNTAVIGARIVTVASGGTITVGTEVTHTFTTGGGTLALGTINIGTPAILSTIAAVISFGIETSSVRSGPNGYNLFALPLAISGTTITLSSSTYPIESFSGMYTSDGNMCAVDSTHVAVQWLESPFAFGSAFSSPINSYVNRAVFIDVNNATPTWASIGSSKSYTSLATLSTSVPSTSVTYACPLQLYIVDNAANLAAYTLSNEAIYVGGTTYSGSSASGHLPKTCNMTFYAGIGPTIQTLQVSRNSSSSMIAYIADATNSTTSGTFSVTGTVGTTRNAYQIIYYGAVNQNFFIYSNGTTNYSGGIVDTTSGIASISYSDQAFITSSTLGTGFTAPALAAISTTAIIMAYVDGNNIKAVIFTISGATITVGTPVTVFSGSGAPTLTAGVAVLSATNGIITYSATGTSTVLYSNGITWSGSTITVGSQSTVLTSQSFTKDGYNIASKSVPVSPTQAIYTYWDNGATAVRALLLTYVSINSITAGTPFSINTNVSSTYADLSIGLVATETGNAVVAVQNYENTSTYETDAQYLYRG